MALFKVEGGGAGYAFRCLGNVKSMRCLDSEDLFEQFEEMGWILDFQNRRR